MFRKIAGLGVVVAAVVTSLSGCVIDGSDSGPNAAIEAQSDAALNYDPDATKESAFGLIFGMPAIDDRLDFDKGDKKDWRYILVSEPGIMSITLNLDTPDKIQGGWNIYDSNERVLSRQSFNQGQGFYEFPNFPVVPGIYYFETFATSGASIYSLGTSFSPRQAPPEPDPEPIAQTTTPKTPSNGGTKKGGGAKKDTPSDDTPKPPKPPKPAPESNEGVKVVGFISLITPKDDGTAEITIRDAGKNKGVETGAVGKIEGLGVKVEMTNCLATSCKAILPKSVNQKSLKQGANVIFYIK